MCNYLMQILIVEIFDFKKFIKKKQLFFILAKIFINNISSNKSLFLDVVV